MQKNTDFSFFHVLLLAVFIGGIVYAVILSRHIETNKVSAKKIAVDLTPAVYAYMQHGLLHGDGDYPGELFFGTDYIVSPSYESTLHEVGFDYNTGNITLTVEEE
jgi:hypothetical protein